MFKNTYVFGNKSGDFLIVRQQKLLFAIPYCFIYLFEKKKQKTSSAMQEPAKVNKITVYNKEKDG